MKWLSSIVLIHIIYFTALGAITYFLSKDDIKEMLEKRKRKKKIYAMMVKTAKKVLAMQQELEELERGPTGLFKAERILEKIKNQEQFYTLCKETYDNL